jgi:uncharacterized protein YjbJ (UPF0337 family)
VVLILRHRTQSVSNPDADHIGGFLDVFDAFEVERVYASDDPKGTLTYSTFLRAAREEGSRLEVVRAGRLLEWGGVRTDAWFPKHPVVRAAIPRHAGRRAGGRAGAGLAVRPSRAAYPTTFKKRGSATFPCEVCSVEPVHCGPSSGPQVLAANPLLRADVTVSASSCLRGQGYQSAREGGSTTMGRKGRGGPEGALDKAAGRLGEAAGKATGDKSLEAEGRATRRKGERKSYVVSPHADGGWKVQAEGARRASSVHRTKAEAQAAGKELARNHAPSQLLVYKKDGLVVQEEQTYG